MTRACFTHTPHHTEHAQRRAPLVCAQVRTMRAHADYRGVLRRTHTYVEFVEEHGVSGAVAARLRRLPELLLCRVSIHRTQFEQAVWGRKGGREREEQGGDC